MNIKQRLQRKYNYLLDKIFLKEQQRKNINEIDNAKGKKTIYFFSVPLHSNLGDQAQYYCWLRLFLKNYPEYRVVSMSARTTTDEELERIKHQVTSDDLLFVHSGYLIFDPHPELPFICKVVNVFHDMPITILPQTINLISAEKKNEISNCFNAHPNLTIITRDEVSLHNADLLFPQCKRLLWPDVVTSLIGAEGFKFDNKVRDGVMFCVRNDLEKFYSKSQIDELKNRFTGYNKVRESDTTINLPLRFWPSRRESLIRKVILDFSKYQLIITDRYHGTIFSQVANTPVIVLSSSDHKLSSGVKWFPRDEFGKNVYYAKDLEEVFTIAQIVLSDNTVHKNPPFFNEKYWNVMKL